MSLGLIRPEQLMNDLRADPPDVCVRTPGSGVVLPGLSEWLAADFIDTGVLRGARVYVRRQG